MLIEASGDDSSSQIPDHLATLEGRPPVSYGSSESAPLSVSTGNREPLQKNWRLIHTLKRASLIARQNTTLPRPQLAPDLDPDGLAALRQIAERGEAQKHRSGWKSWDHSPVSRSEPLSYADPLSPLRERDEIALLGLFQETDMAAIETDISRCLLQLLPAPCWEDDPMEFLQEFLRA